MSGVNKVILIGNLGRDPESREVGDSTVCNFSIATTREWFDKKKNEKREETEWHRIAVWGKAAEACAKYLTKGRQVYVEGRLQTRKYEKDGVEKYATDIIAETVQFLGGKGDGKTREPGDDSGHEWGDPPKGDAGGSDF